MSLIFSFLSKIEEDYDADQEINNGIDTLCKMAEDLTDICMQEEGIAGLAVISCSESREFLLVKYASRVETITFNGICINNSSIRKSALTIMNNIGQDPRFVKAFNKAHCSET